MASFMAKIKQVPKNLPHGTERVGIKGTLVDKGERYGAAFAFGAAKGYYGEKFLFKGHGLDLWIGGATLAASVALNVVTNGHSSIAAHLERVGDAGVMSAIGSLGAAWGLDKAGRSVHVLTPGKNASAGGPKKTIVGHIPPAVAGNYLSADQIANYAASR